MSGRGEAASQMPRDSWRRFCAAAAMFRDDTRSEARGFLENVTGLPFVGYSVSGDLTVVNVAEREAELLASKVLVERPTIMISMRIEPAPRAE